MKISTRIIDYHLKEHTRRAKLENHSFRKEERVRERKSGSSIKVNPFVSYIENASLCLPDSQIAAWST